MSENKKEPTAKEIVKGWENVLKDWKPTLTEEEKAKFEKIRFEEKMSRKYPPKFKTCGPGCPNLRKP